MIVKIEIMFYANTMVSPENRHATHLLLMLWVGVSSEGKREEKSKDLFESEDRGNHSNEFKCSYLSYFYLAVFFF